MPNLLRSKYAYGAFAGLSLVGLLAGCASTTEASTTDTGTTDSTTDSSTAAGTYTDGTYTAEGDYVSPGGSQTVAVELTLADNVVTAVTVTPEASDPTAERYQTEFADGIAAEVVGKNIDDLDVSRVAGSSLTSTGFNDAVEQIKTEATA